MGSENLNRVFIKAYGKGGTTNPVAPSGETAASQQQDPLMVRFDTATVQIPAPHLFTPPREPAQPVPQAYPMSQVPPPMRAAAPIPTPTHAPSATTVAQRVEALSQQVETLSQQEMTEWDETMYSLLFGGTTVVAPNTAMASTRRQPIRNQAAAADGPERVPTPAKEVVTRPAMSPTRTTSDTRSSQPQQNLAQQIATKNQGGEIFRLDRPSYAANSGGASMPPGFVEPMEGDDESPTAYDMELEQIMRAQSQTDLQARQQPMQQAYPQQTNPQQASQPVAQRANAQQTAMKPMATAPLNSAPMATTPAMPTNYQPQPLGRGPMVARSGDTTRSHDTTQSDLSVGFSTITPMPHPETMGDSHTRNLEKTKRREQVLRQSRMKIFNPLWEVDRLQWPQVCSELSRAMDEESSTVVENLMRACQEGLQVLAVTSPQSGEGTSTVACCLAMLAGKHGLNIALVDSNIENPSLSYQTNLELDVDWHEAVAKRMPLEEIAVHSVDDQVTLVPLLERLNAPELNEHNVARMLQELSQSFDLVIVDLGNMSSPRSMVRKLGELGVIHAVVAVVDRRLGSPDRIESCLRQIRQTGIASIGLVENFAA